MTGTQQHSGSAGCPPNFARGTDAVWHGGYEPLRNRDIFGNTDLGL